MILVDSPGHCLLKGTLYEHGDRFAPKECAECVCHDGNMQCTRVDPETACPPLPCDPPDQFTVPGECCKFCPGNTSSSSLVILKGRRQFRQILSIFFSSLRT